MFEIENCFFCSVESTEENFDHCDYCSRFVCPDCHSHCE